MARALCVAGFVVAINFGISLGGEQSPSLLEQIERLVRDLDAPQRSVRDQAERQLEQLNGDILPILNRAAPTSAEARWRLERIRSRLVARRIEGATEPTRVSLQLEKVAFRDAVAALSQQTGWRIMVPDQVAELAISGDFREVPFWEVLENLAQQAGLEVRPAEEGVFSLTSPGDAGRLIGISYHGPFRLVVREGTSLQNGSEAAETPDEAQARRLFRVELAWEPRLHPAFIWWGPASLVCAGGRDEGVSAASRREIPVVGTRSALDVRIPMQNACPEGTAARFRGIFEVVLPVCFEPFIFEKPVAGSTGFQELGDVRVRLVSWREESGTARIALRAEYRNPQEAFGSHRGWFYSWPAVVEGDSFQRPSQGLEALWLGENGVELMYVFRDLPGPAKQVTWSVPLAIRKLRHEFDIPLGK